MKVNASKIGNHVSVTLQNYQATGKRRPSRVELPLNLLFAVFAVLLPPAVLLVSVQLLKGVKERCGL